MPSSDPVVEAQGAPEKKDTAKNTQKAEKASDKGTAGKPPNPPAAGGALTGAELKAQKKAEKAARRAQEAQARQAPSTLPPSAGQGATSTATSAGNASNSQHGNKGAKPESGGGQHKRNASQANVVSKGSHTNGTEVPAVEDKTVELFRHLYKPKSTTIANAAKEVHPAVLALGVQMSSYTICGSIARLVATLQAFKRVIESYTTPPGNTLQRHFTPHVLSPQIDYLTSCRPLSISMGTAIRWLKLRISKVDIDEPDASAKESLCADIDEYLRDRVILADEVISKTAAQQCIKDGDVILTYAKSNVVKQALFKAHRDGRKFSVIVVDSRPLFEGKAMAKSLVDAGMDVKYYLTNGMSHCIRDATKVLLGAHAMMSNGRLFNRVGTAQVAMEANDFDIPVIVLCESIKCTEKVALDSVVFNEVAPPDELIIPPQGSGDRSGSLADWRSIKNLQLLNLMYDVTPADYITMIVTEHGIVPPSSVPVLQRLANETQ